MDTKNTIWTIGHSTHPQEEFINWLNSHQITALADIRRFPGSRKFPHFKKEHLEIYLPENDISYYHFEDLGGRRKAHPDSLNKIWRHPSFRGYADYMETDEFKAAVKDLKQIALKKRTAVMCSEAVWWSCHRAMVSDYLKVQDWEVLHIMGEGKASEHPYTSPAKKVNGKLTYQEPE